MASRAATKAAFDKFRTNHGPPWGPRFIRDASEGEQMGGGDGLVEFTDGPGPTTGLPSVIQLLDPSSLPSPKRLWVVRPEDVVHALEECEFGAKRAAGRVKHTNLTGGNPAFSGGELLFLDDGTLIVSGDSGRYGPRNADEMRDAALAFKESGYEVYSMGYDSEANRAFPFIGVAPRLI